MRRTVYLHRPLLSSPRGLTISLISPISVNEKRRSAETLPRDAACGEEPKRRVREQRYCSTPRSARCGGRQLFLFLSSLLLTANALSCNLFLATPADHLVLVSYHTSGHIGRLPPLSHEKLNKPRTAVVRPNERELTPRFCSAVIPRCLPAPWSAGLGSAHDVIRSVPRGHTRWLDLINSRPPERTVNSEQNSLTESRCRSQTTPIMREITMTYDALSVPGHAVECRLDSPLRGLFRVRLESRRSSIDALQCRSNGGPSC